MVVRRAGGAGDLPELDWFEGKGEAEVCTREGY